MTAICRPGYSALPEQLRALILAALLISGTAVAAAEASFSLQQIDGQGWQASTIVLNITPGEQHHQVSLNIDQLVISDPSLQARVKLACDFPVGNDASRCTDGRLELVLTPAPGLVPLTLPERLNLKARLDWDLQPERSLLSLGAITMAEGHIDLDGTLTDTGWQIRLHAIEQALGPLLKVLTPMLSLPPPAEDIQGQTAVSANIVSEQGQPLKLNAQASITDSSFTGISSAAEALAMNWQLDASEQTDGWDFSLKQTLLAGGVYIELPLQVGALTPGFTLTADQGEITSDLQGQWQDGLLQFSFTHRHPDTVMATGEARILMPSTALQQLDLSLESSRFSNLYEVYLQPLLLNTPGEDLETSGSVSARLKLAGTTLESLHLEAQDLYLYDRQQRFYLDKVDLLLPLGNAVSNGSGHLGWDGAGLYQLDLDAARLEFAIDGRNLGLSQPASIPLLDGKLQIDTLKWLDIGGDGMRFSADSILTPIDLERLCEALGWPIMSGQVSGVIPGLNYSQGNLSVDGTLLTRAFDGRAVIRNLAIRDLFSPVPLLAADIELQELDLEQLTATLAFGRITGRLEGHIRNLQLEAWQPVTLDAWFANPEDDDSRHRINQRAIDNLSRIGGGVQTGGLTRSMLGVFSDFGYDRLGLGCTLENGICQMQGLEPKEQGFIILRKGLLPPWIQIVGHNRAVDWPILLKRLKGIAEGNRPEIRSGLLQ